MKGITFDYYIGKCQFTKRDGRMIFFADTQSELQEIVSLFGSKEIQEEVCKYYNNLFELLEE